MIHEKLFILVLYLLHPPEVRGHSDTCEYSDADVSMYSGVTHHSFPLRDKTHETGFIIIIIIIRGGEREEMEVKEGAQDP